MSDLMIAAFKQAWQSSQGQVIFELLIEALTRPRGQAEACRGICSGLALRDHHLGAESPVQTPSSCPTDPGPVCSAPSVRRVCSAPLAAPHPGPRVSLAASPSHDQLEEEREIRLCVNYSRAKLETREMIRNGIGALTREGASPSPRQTQTLLLSHLGICGGKSSSPAQPPGMTGESRTLNKANKTKHQRGLTCRGRGPNIGEQRGELVGAEGKEAKRRSADAPPFPNQPLLANRPGRGPPSDLLEPRVGGGNGAHFIDVKTEMRFSDPKVASKGLKPLAPCQARRLRQLSQPCSSASALDAPMTHTPIIYRVASNRIPTNWEHSHSQPQPDLPKFKGTTQHVGCHVLLAFGYYKL
ncbi:uncharacterized protein LOC116590235 [Mustela erminea]|uniref:uncharacterized protein LOC116590235 n=1 Tax=Mustela erminea TaxID=36723 RepID=UPI001386A12C|nr:uncharacterized protein LOC116590235 [Mustela erminea]